jgi:hypothetical protein
LLPQKILAAATAHGLPLSSAEDFLTNLLGGQVEQLASLPGVKSSTIEASVVAMKQAYLDSFHVVWYATCPFAAIGVIGEILAPRLLLHVCC